MKFPVTRMGSPSVVSVAAACEDEALHAGICKSDYVRNETLRRCCAIPSYKYKSLKWKNRYYDLIRNKVLTEIGGW